MRFTSMLQLVAKQDTVLKHFLADSSKLPADKKQSFPQGSRLTITKFQEERNHLRLYFPDKDQFLYAFIPHIKVVEAEKLIYPPEFPEKVKLNVPYKSQRDNWNNPDGSCNVTSIAMCLAFLGIQPMGNIQLEDELYEYCLEQGYSRHSPEDLAKVVRDYGRKDYFTSSATIEQLKKHLAGGNPAVIHGYFTTYGHIVCCVGYDETRGRDGFKNGLIIHDPWGEWNDWGYANTSGAFLNYSYDMIRQTCMDDGQFWVHFISR